MDGIPIPKTLTIYTLIKQTGMNFTYSGFSSSSSLGIGFFLNEKDAEYQRTMEILKDEAGSRYHIFPLTVPNPAYKD